MAVTRVGESEGGKGDEATNLTRKRLALSEPRECTPTPREALLETSANTPDENCITIESYKYASGDLFHHNVVHVQLLLDKSSAFREKLTSTGSHEFIILLFCRELSLSLYASS